MTVISAVLFDFAGVLTSSPWGALTAAGGGNLELLEDPGTWSEPAATVFRLTLPVSQEL